MMPLQRHIKNVVRNYTEAERKVREATSNDSWGPSSTLMSDIADRTYNVIAFTEIMQMIWRRLNDKSKYWRHVYKALVLLEYIIKTGSDKVAVQCKENIHAIETLMDFYHVEDGKDVGNSVRDRARSLNALLRDEERLQEERAKAMLARERLVQGDALGVTTHSSCSSSSFSPTKNAVRSSLPPTASVGLPTDLDSAQPQSYTEEQLQLRLAIAISKEEHERELQKRHEEEAKEALTFQMALEQSKRDEQSGSLISQSGETGGAVVSTSHASGSLFNLIDTSLSVAAAGVPDPWSTIVPVPATSASTKPSNALFPSSVEVTSIISCNATATGRHPSIPVESPWMPRDPIQPQQPSHPLLPGPSNNPWTVFDPLVNGPPLQQNGNSLPIVSTCGDSFLESTTIGSSNDSTTNSTLAPSKRTPADFLGDHKGLVDLEKLVDRNPDSKNPFATSCRSIIGQSTNPFTINKPTKPSLNQLCSSTSGAPLPVMGEKPPSTLSFAQCPPMILPSTSNKFPSSSVGTPHTQFQHYSQSLNPFF